jgi:hypothetical protein
MFTECSLNVHCGQVKYLEEAREFRDANIVDVTSYEELKAAILDNKWARGGWAASDADEEKIKASETFTICCLIVPTMFPQRFLNFSSLFSACSLNGP